MSLAPFFYFSEFCAVEPTFGIYKIDRLRANSGPNSHPTTQHSPRMSARLFAVIAAAAAVLTFVAFVFPQAGAAAMVLVIAGALTRAVAVWPLRAVPGGAGPAPRLAGIVYAFIAAELLIILLTVAGIGLGPSLGGVAPGAAAWLSTIGWLVYGLIWSYAGLRFAILTGWTRAFAIMVMIAGLLWITVIGMIAWPFVAAAAYLCLAIGLWRGLSMPAPSPA